MSTGSAGFGKTALILAVILVGGCSADASPPESQRSETPQSLAGGSRSVPTPPPDPTVDVRPSGPIPRRPARLADDLAVTEAALFQEIDAWRQGEGSRRSAARVALRQQKIYRLLVRKPALSGKVVARLAASKAERVEHHVAVASALRAGVTPLNPPLNIRTRRPRPVAELVGYFKGAGNRFDIDWEVLAAINFVETRFGRLIGPSSAGALGPMQFLPSTWDQYGAGGDIFDPRDSIFAAARLLEANGATSNLRPALLAYNNSDAYVDAVRMYAQDIHRDLRHLYAYYLWQVFVITSEGDTQITGPKCCNRSSG